MTHLPLTRRTLLPVIAPAMLLSLSGCQVIGDIFKAGIGVGVFIVVALVAVVGGIAALAMRKG
jgi:hypothetical protein